MLVLGGDVTEGPREGRCVRPEIESYVDSTNNNLVRDTDTQENRNLRSPPWLLMNQALRLHGLSALNQKGSHEISHTRYENFDWHKNGNFQNRFDIWNTLTDAEKLEYENLFQTDNGIISHQGYGKYITRKLSNSRPASEAKVKMVALRGSAEKLGSTTMAA